MLSAGTNIYRYASIILAPAAHTAPIPCPKRFCSINRVLIVLQRTRSSTSSIVLRPCAAPGVVVQPTTLLLIVVRLHTHHPATGQWMFYSSFLVIVFFSLHVFYHPVSVGFWDPVTETYKLQLPSYYLPSSKSVLQSRLITRIISCCARVVQLLHTPFIALFALLMHGLPSTPGCFVRLMVHLSNLCWCPLGVPSRCPKG